LRLYNRDEKSLFRIWIYVPKGLTTYKYAHFAHLLAISYENRLYSSDDAPEKLNQVETHALSKLIVQEAAKYFHTGLYGDNDLKNCIDWELSHRKEQNDGRLATPQWTGTGTEKNDPLISMIIKVINPLLLKEEITGPDLPETIANHIRIALEKARASFIKRKILLVCGAGMATAYSLKSQILTIFPEIEIVGISSAFELAHNANEWSNIDAIITTVPLGAVIRIPQIKVNAFLTNSDKESIRSILELNGINYSGIEENTTPFSTAFSEILTCKTIRCRVNADSPHNLIELTGQLLLDKHAIWPSYIKAMKDLYSLYGSYMVIAPNTAFFHAGPEMGARCLSASLVTLESPVSFNHSEYDPVKIAIAFASPHHANHTHILSDVFGYFMQDENRDRILAAGSPQEIYKYLQTRFRSRSKVN
jgi:ascorbate PTS system EIIA or EIIAB component